MLVFDYVFLIGGAVGEIRTPTPLRKLVPETSTSTNSVTTAYCYYWIFYKRREIQSTYTLWFG